jgi:hypothetical protein
LWTLQWLLLPGLAKYKPYTCTMAAEKEPHQNNTAYESLTQLLQHPHTPLFATERIKVFGTHTGQQSFSHKE